MAQEDTRRTGIPAVAVLAVALILLPTGTAEASCSAGNRVDHRDAECLSAGWKNRGLLKKSPYHVRNMCPEYGKVVAKVDLKSASDRTLHLNDGLPRDREAEARKEAGVGIGLADDLRSIRTALVKAKLAGDFEAAFDLMLFQLGRSVFTDGYKSHALDIAVRETADRPTMRMNDADFASWSPGEAMLEDRSGLAFAPDPGLSRPPSRDPESRDQSRPTMPLATSPSSDRLMSSAMR